MYNYNISRKYFEKYSSIFLVEGYMDVINFYDKGVENVAGILGTAITLPQIKLAWKNYKNIIVCFDGIKVVIWRVIEPLKKFLLTRCLEKMLL